MEKLQRYQTTELPGQKKLYPFFPNPMLQDRAAACGTLFEKGFFDINSEENVVGVKARGIRELTAEAWGSS
jgi:hypothetical protein